MVYAIAFAINLGLCITLIPRFGIEGAAMATSTALVAESLMLFAVARSKLGFHVFILSKRRSDIVGQRKSDRR